MSAGGYSCADEWDALMREDKCLDCGCGPFMCTTAPWYPWHNLDCPCECHNKCECAVCGGESGEANQHPAP
jgi:hypothetical protein